MEQMRLELGLEGVEVHFVAINAVSASDPEDQAKLVNRCAFPLLQDTDEVDAWGLHDAGKDDFVIYDAQGRVAAYLPVGGDLTTDLRTDEGYANLKNAILEAVAQ